MIYVECNPDEALIKALGIPRRGIHHSGNKVKVCKRLQKSKNSKGLVDDDPLSEKPPYIDRMKLHSNEHNIKLLYDERSKNYLIVLCPRLEEWILEASKEVNIDVSNYSLPNKPVELHKIVNTRIKEFEKLIEDLIKQGSRMLKTLEKLIKGKNLI